MNENQIRAIAFYLPQFHPIPENDEWWGKGFTEWTNVTKARPLFRGHNQPHLPADLGFYDLRLGETREAQAALARQYGIHGFCYYHYWFNGRRILERPVNEIIASGKPDFPFCLCWANENWTRRWDGEDDEVLLRQNYSPEDDVAHIQALARYLNDPRYIRVDGKPLLLIYRVANLPDPAGTVSRWRSEIKRMGLPGLYLCNVENVPRDRVSRSAGFDAAVEFAPDCTAVPPPQRRSIPWRLARKLRLAPRLFKEHYITDYEEFMRRMLGKAPVDYLLFHGLTPSWDNSARRKKGAQIFLGATPELYGQWLREIVRRTQVRPPEQRIIFINAWNEWAEGNHLEPCQRLGRAYLEETARALGCLPPQKP
jgi:lipopolysaccharide biosynthesis protein